MTRIAPHESAAETRTPVRAEPAAAEVKPLARVLGTPMSFEAFLEKLGAKDRLNAQKHVAACEAGPEPRHAALWQQLACGMMTLAGHSAKLNGQQSAQFYVADGKYRMQVFALEDLCHGVLAVYCTDVLGRAIDGGLLVAPLLPPAPPASPGGDFGGAGAPGLYGVCGSADRLAIEQLDGGTTDPANFFKDMLGWNRKAIRVTLPVAATAPQVRAVESLCALSVPGGALPPV